MSIIIADITRERKMQQAAADEGRKLAEGILSCIDDAVVLLDARGGTISFLNPAAARMFGYGQDSCTGKSAGFLAGSSGMVPGYSAGIEEAFRLQGFFEVESRMKRGDGMEFLANLQLRPVYSSGGGLRNIVMVVRDLTVRTGTRPEVMHDAWYPAQITPARFSPAGRHSNQAI
jgi:PAS domain S-box-containing protein